MGTFVYRPAKDVLPPEVCFMDPAEYWLKEGAYKAYVIVGAEFHPDGQILPRWIGWEDGKRYAIDRVKDKRRMENPKAGGSGICYQCEIGTSKVRLFYEGNGRWFVERKRPKGG